MTMSDEATDTDPPRTDTRPREWWRWPALGLLTLLLVALAFWRCRHDFFLADDFSALYAAQRADGLREALDVTGSFRLRLIREVVPDFAATSTLLRPVTSLSFWLDYLGTGLVPTGFHMTAFVLHALVVLAVAALALVMTNSVVAAVAAVAVFAVHPAHTEAVVWIAARADLTVTLCMLAALLAWVRYVDVGGGRRLAAACLAFAIGLLSKEMAVSVPALAWVLVWLRPPPRDRRRIAVGLGALGMTLLAYVGLRLALVGSFRAYHAAEGGVLGALANAARFLADAFLLSVWTGDRVAHPDFDALRTLHAGAALTLVLLARPGRDLARIASVCAAALCVSALPVAAWAGLGADGSGTRLVYPSLVFVAVALAAVTARAYARRPATTAVALSALTIASLLGTWRAAAPWQRAASKAAAIVEQLATAAAGSQALVLCNDLPAREGPAYLAQNAFPSAAWLFVTPGLRIEWLPRPQWEAAVVEHRATLQAQPQVRALRWDDAAGRWLPPTWR